MRVALADAFRKQMSQLVTSAGHLLNVIPVKAYVLALPVLVVLLSSAFFVLLDPDADRLRVTFLNTGSGDAILLRTPNHQNILIGAGTTPDGVVRALGTRLPVWERRIDLLVLPDTSEAYVLGAEGVIRRYQVGAILDNGASNTPAEWKNLLEAQQITHIFARPQQEIDLGGGLALTVLDARDGSMMLKIDYRDGQGASILLAGTANLQSQLALLEQQDDLRRATLLHIPNHGNRSGFSAAFLQQVHPRIAVITPGQTVFGREWSGPASDVSAELEAMQAQVYRLDQLGSLTITFTSERALSLRRE